MPNRQNWNPSEHYKNAGVAESYDGTRFSSLAGRMFNALERRLIQKALAGLPRSSVVGDIPCGTGRLAETVLSLGFTVIGVDISAQMLDVARRRLERFGDRLHTEVCDARQLPASSLRFDAALCARVLMHFPLEEQIAFLRGVVAVTRGRVIITQGLDTAYHRMRRGLKRVLRHQNPASYPLTAQDLARLLRESGLREVRRYPLLPLISESLVIVAEPQAGSA